MPLHDSMYTTYPEKVNPTVPVSLGEGSTQKSTSTRGTKHPHTCNCRVKWKWHWGPLLIITSKRGCQSLGSRAPVFPKAMVSSNRSSLSAQRPQNPREWLTERLRSQMSPRTAALSLGCTQKSPGTTWTTPQTKPIAVWGRLIQEWYGGSRGEHLKQSRVCH